jgi:hypothetical protein
MTAALNNTKRFKGSEYVQLTKSLFKDFEDLAKDDEEINDIFFLKAAPAEGIDSK